MAGIFVVTLVLAMPAEAPAWVQTSTKSSGGKLHWKYINRVKIQLNSNGDPKIKDGSDLTAVRNAMKNWNEPIAHCSYIKFEEQTPPLADVKAGYSREQGTQNVVVWSSNSWLYDKSAVALTTIQHVNDASHSQDGRILDADIELNGVHYTFSATGAKSKHDIENTVTHELGHVLGIAHPCDDGQTAKPPVDHNGDVVPSCRSARVPAWMRETTMWFNADLGETKKRSLEQDDIDAACGIYPIGSDPTLDTGGCVVGATAARRGTLPVWPGWLALLVVVAIARRRLR